MPKAIPAAPPWQGVAGPRAVVDPAHARKLLAREPGEPMTGLGKMDPRSAPSWETGGDERAWAVRRGRST